MTYDELLQRARNLHKSATQSQRQAKYFYKLYQKEKQKHITSPPNYKPTSSDLAKLVDISIKENWLTENSVLYAVLTDTMKSLKLHDEQVKRNGKLTQSKTKPHPKGMRFSPVVIKWSCKIANKCRKSGYEAVRSILPIPTWETTKQYRQSTSTTEPISQENLQLMVQELKRRRCKGIGGIH